MEMVFRNGVIYRNKRECELYEEASLRLGMTVIEIIRFIEAMLMVEMDPIRPTGAKFEFGRKVQGVPDHDFSWMNVEVPAPNDRVDLWQAWAQMENDHRACEYIMENQPTNADVLKAVRNQLAWFRFGAIRWPTENGRKAFRGLAEIQEASITALIETGRTKRGGDEVTKALQEMLAS
jgi:hypothetical protein